MADAVAPTTAVATWRLAVGGVLLACSLVSAANTYWQYGRKLRLLRRARPVASASDLEAALDAAHVHRAIGTYAKVNGTVACDAPLTAGASGLQVAICHITTHKRRSWWTGSKVASQRNAEVPFHLKVGRARIDVRRASARFIGGPASASHRCMCVLAESAHGRSTRGTPSWIWTRPSPAAASSSTSMCSPWVNPPSWSACCRSGRAVDRK